MCLRDRQSILQTIWETRNKIVHGELISYYPGGIIYKQKRILATIATLVLKQIIQWLKESPSQSFNNIWTEKIDEPSKEKFLHIRKNK